MPVDSVDPNRTTALSAAANAGKLAVVEELLKRGADVELANADGETPIMRAALARESDVVRTLIKVSTGAL